jgi:hypothetical protein
MRSDSQLLERIAVVVVGKNWVQHPFGKKRFEILMLSG